HAATHNMDNRIMYSAGVAARRMGLVDWDLAMGVPLAMGTKNIFFDRK
ncbi:MAG: ferredoxin domain-containing protein, partial [Pseudomonadota bacterium]